MESKNIPSGIYRHYKGNVYQVICVTLEALVCDIDDENAAEERKQLVRDTDSDIFKAMMEAYWSKLFSESYKKWWVINAVSCLTKSLNRAMPCGMFWHSVNDR